MGKGPENRPFFLQSTVSDMQSMVIETAQHQFISGVQGFYKIER